MPDQIYQSSVQSPRNLARAVHMRDVENSKIDSLNVPKNSNAEDSFERNEASKNQQDVFYAEKKDTSQKTVQTNPPRRRNT